MTGKLTIDSTYITKDSGQRREFVTGSRRDVADGKGRYDKNQAWSFYHRTEC